MPRLLFILSLLLSGCTASRPPEPAAPPAKLELILDGPLIERRTIDAGVEFEVRLVGQSVWPGVPPTLPGRLVSSEADLPAGLTLPEPVDFSHWLGVLMNSVSGLPLVVSRAEAQVTDTETRAVLSGPPPVCGGASITHELAQQRALSSPPTLVLVPRRPRVVIGVIDNRCDPRLP